MCVALLLSGREKRGSWGMDARGGAAGRAGQAQTGPQRAARPSLGGRGWA